MTRSAEISEQADSVPELCRSLALRGQAASRSLGTAPRDARDQALERIAHAIEREKRAIQQANAEDLQAGRAAGLGEAMLDRLELDDARVAKMAQGVRQVAGQPDPLGRVLDGRVLGNGIRLQKVRVAMGVVLIIFESRPNVTVDAAALCVKSGNAVILRGGKEAKHSNAAIAQCVRAGVEEAGLDPDLVQLVPTTDRAAVGELLKQEGVIDLCIPRGGESLIRAVVEQAHIPVIKHYTGNCHVYVDEHADAQMATEICLNAKTQRTGVCNAAETLVFHEAAVGNGLLGRIVGELIEQGVEVRGDEATRASHDAVKEATEEDWATEYLDKVVAVRVVGSLNEAVGHINRYGSKHTDAIVTARMDAADAFVQQVDTANAMVNCSTRFSDGFEYGLGAEIGISTDKLHARGPMGAEDLTTYKWVAYGNGQVRG